MANRITRGADQSPDKKFLSMNQKKFNEKHNRRLLEQPTETNFKDYLEYTMTVNKDIKDGRKELVAKSPVYMQKGQHMDSSKTTFAPCEFKRDLNGSHLQYQAREIAVKPTVLEKGLAANDNFARLSDGFKRVFTEDCADRNMRIPVVGYTGHRKGETAENMFAKNFRESGFEAVRNMRIAKQTTSSNYIRT